MQQYVPDTIRRLWAKGHGIGPSEVSAPSAVLFADITGFTPLVSRLTGKGRAEIEELRHALDTYFGRAVNCVTEHGGDVFAFAGDALLGLWWDEGDPDEAVARAAACAEVVRAELSGWQAAPGLVLELRLVVSAGQTKILTVGGLRDRWESLAVGTAISSIGPALSLAQPGEVVATAAAWPALAGIAEADALSDGCFRLKRLEPRTAAARVLTGVAASAAQLHDARLLPAVRLWRGNEAFLGERRRLSVQFIQLPAIDEANANWLSDLHETVLDCQQTIGEWEGTLTEVTADDKGLVVVAAWGLPPISHEDDAQGAIESALAIRKLFEQRRRSVSIGIATGAAYCRLVGNEVRAAYTMLGAPVNLAARLMQAAKGRILSDETTFNAVKSRFAFNRLDAIKVKGHDQPVAIHEPYARRGPELSLQRVELVGRDLERDRVDTAIDGLATGRGGGVLLIEGDPGIGKSALANHLITQAVSRGVRVLRGQARSVLRTTPYHGVAGVLADALGIQHSGDADQLESSIVGAFSDQDDLLRVPLLGDIFGITMAPTPFTVRLSPEAELDARNAFASLILARMVARERVVVVVDDAHWLDSASWSLLAVFSRAVPEALLVAVGRTTGSENALRQITHAASLVLNPLPDEALFILAGRQLSTSRVPEAIRRVLAERAGGNPFFAYELVATLLATGQVRVDGGICQVVGSAIDIAALPTTVSGLVTARVDRMPAVEQRALKVASVIGRAFSIEMLCAIAPGQLNATELETRFSKNELIGVGSRAGTWEFRQMLVREAVYDGLLLDQRKEWHGAVVRHLVDNLAPAALVPHFPALALHATAAEDWPVAMRYSDLAGSEALGSWANAEAARFSQSALHIATSKKIAVSPEQRARWEARLAEAYFRLGDMDATVGAGYRALGAWGVPLPDRPLREVSALVREWWARYRPFSPSRLDSADQRTLLDLYGRLVDAQGFRQSAGGFLLNLFRELALAEALDMPGRMARTWLMFYFFFAPTPLESRARPWVDRARSLLSRETDAGRKGSVTLRLGVASVYGAQWNDAMTAIQAGMRLVEAQGEQRNQCEALMTLCHIYSIRGQFLPLLEAGAEIRAITRLTGDKQIETLCIALVADATFRSGNLESAERTLLEHGESLDRLTGGANRVLSQGIRARVAWGLGDYGAASTLAKEVLETHEKLLAPTFWTHAGLLGMAEVLFEQAKLAAGDAVSRDLAKRARAQLLRNGRSFRFSRALGAWGNAQWALVRQQRDEACRAARAAVVIARGDGILYLEARSLLEEAELTEGEAGELLAAEGRACLAVLQAQTQR